MKPFLTYYCYDSRAKLDYQVIGGGETDDAIHSSITWPDYVILHNPLKVFDSTCYSAATITMQSWVIWLLEVASQMIQSH